MTKSNKQYSAAIGLINPKSPSNVGAVIRAVGCYQADAIFYTGQRYAKAAKFNTDTKNRIETIPLEPVENFVDEKLKDYTLVCVDLIEGATPLPEFKHPDNALYIFGPEDGSIDQTLIDSAKKVVYVPTVGCMNLAASVNVILYDRMVKQGDYEQGDILIQRSRDTNNKTKVRG